MTGGGAVGGTLPPSTSLAGLGGPRKSLPLTYAEGPLAGVVPKDMPCVITKGVPFTLSRNLVWTINHMVALILTDLQ